MVKNSASLQTHLFIVLTHLILTDEDSKRSDVTSNWCLYAIAVVDWLAWALAKQVVYTCRRPDVEGDGSRSAASTWRYQRRYSRPATTTPAVHVAPGCRRRPRRRRRSGRQLSVHCWSRRGVPPAAVTSCQTQELLLRSVSPNPRRKTIYITSLLRQNTTALPRKTKNITVPMTDTICAISRCIMIS